MGSQVVRKRKLCVVGKIVCLNRTLMTVLFCYALHCFVKIFCIKITVAKYSGAYCKGWNMIMSF